MRIGRKGVTPGIIDEVGRRLELKDWVKVKVLKGALRERTREEIAQLLVQNTESKLIEIRGNTLTLYKKGGGFSP